MKKLLLICALMFPVLAFSQVHMGLKGGANFSKLTKDFDSDYRTGYHFGLYGEFKAKSVGIQPEIIYKTGGGEKKQGLFQGDLRLDYIAVPILVNFYASDFFAIQLGPQFMYNSLAEVKSTIGGVSTTTDVKESFESTSFAATAGLLIKLPLGFNVSGRYVFGASNISKSNNTDTRQDFIMISLGKNFF
jgi:hypothetical protein